MTDYLENTSMRPEFMGLTSTLNPFPGRLAAARNNMFANNCSQYLLFDNGEHPLVYTGFESMISDYCHNSAEIEEDIMVIDVIPKYQDTIGMGQISKSSEIFVVYKGLETDQIGYFSIRKYTKCSQGFGYKNVPTDHYYSLAPSAVLSKGTRLYSSVANTDGEYKYGINANVAYITDVGTTQDPFVVSDEFAKKIVPAGVDTIVIDIEPDKYGINTYGDSEEVKILPDIGERVRADGVLCAFRRTSDAAIMNDLSKDRLTEINMHDEITVTKAGATVVDIDIFMGSKSKISSTYSAQLYKYNSMKTRFYQRIYDIYMDHINSNSTSSISHKFNTLVTEAISMLVANGKNIKGFRVAKRLSLTDTKKPINIRVEVTVSYPIPLSRGFKMTGREGGKGVISISTRPAEDMPVDENGIRADVLCDPMAVLKRTNINQLVEQFLNRTSIFVIRQVKALPTDKQFGYIVEYLSMMNMKYSEKVAAIYSTEEKRAKFVQEWCNKPLLNILPMSTELSRDKLIMIADKYGSRATRVSFNVSDGKGGKHRVSPKNPIMIGAKFMMLLNKVPSPSAPGVGYHNHLNMPVHNTTKNRHGISMTPIRFGEDEFRILMTKVGSIKAARLKHLLGSSTKGRRAVLESILSSRSPSAIKRIPISDQALKDDDKVASLVHSMFNVAGIDMKHIKIKETEANAYFELLKPTESE